MPRGRIIIPLGNLTGYLATALHRDANEVKKETVKEFFDLVVEATPIKTGRARASWNVSVGAVSTQTADKDHPSAIANAAATLAIVKSGEPVFVTNSVPYIRKLEKGSSKQAPQGMVKVTVEAIRAKLRQIVETVLAQAP